MGGFAGTWGVAGGFALDLFLGRTTRAHTDVDVAVLRRDQLRLRDHLSGWQFRNAVEGDVRRLADSEVLELPVHEIYASGPAGERVEFLLNEAEEQTWLFRRDSRVKLPLSEAFLRTETGTPILSPAIVLLFKAKSPRPVDEQDFDVAVGGLDARQVAWLSDALRTVHPDHAWIRRLL